MSTSVQDPTEVDKMTFELRFVPSVPGLPPWACFYRTFDHLITAVMAELALGARDDELFVSCPEGVSRQQYEELLLHGVQFTTNRR
jgi:hypothetical protein